MIVLRVDWVLFLLYNDTSTTTLVRAGNTVSMALERDIVAVGVLYANTLPSQT